MSVYYWKKAMLFYNYVLGLTYTLLKAPNPLKDGSDGVTEVDGVLEPQTPLVDQSYPIFVSPSSPTHPNFYIPPGENPTSEINQPPNATASNEKTENNLPNSPSQPPATPSCPVNLVLRLRLVVHGWFPLKIKCCVSLLLVIAITPVAGIGFYQNLKELLNNEIFILRFSFFDFWACSQITLRLVKRTQL